MTGQQPTRRLFGARAPIPALACATLLSATLIDPAFAQEATMSEIRPELRYSVTIRAEDVQARLFVNGAPLVLHASLEPMLMTVPITEMLQPGGNVIALDYEPLNAEAQSYTPQEGVAVEVQLQRQSDFLAETPLAEAVDLFSGRYNAETGRMERQEVSVFTGRDLVRRNGGLQAGKVSMAPVSMVFNNRVSGDHAMRLMMQIDITDTPMSIPPWTDSPPLTDRPELRRELAARYRALHDIIAGGNEAAWRARMDLVYGHGALVLGFKDAAALADEIRNKVPLGPEEGSRLAPLPEDLENGTLEFGSDNRMVRVTPDPIWFETPEGDSARAYGVFFCRKADALRICFMQSIPS